MLFWRRLFGAGSQPQTSPLPPSPGRPICVIGDVHGMADLLDALLDLIANQPQSDSARALFVGDLIDRGPDSAAVLRRVYGLCQHAPDRFICLMGNHERMMLNFLSSPVAEGPRWLTAGGQETLYSFGIRSGLSGLRPAQRFPAMADALRTAMTPDLLEWIKALPLFWQDDGVAVVHASAHPDRPLTHQTESTLLWGKPPTKLRTDGATLVHGHVIVPSVAITPGRIAVDTGAWRTGLLSAVWLDQHGARALSVTATTIPLA